MVDAQEASDGLLLEPLAHVALSRAGTSSQLARRRVALVGEGAVEAEPAAEMDRCDLEGVDHGSEHPLDERIGVARGRGSLGLAHGCPPRLGPEGREMQQPVEDATK